jgi:hypothetical protein
MLAYGFATDMKCQHFCWEQITGVLQNALTIYELRLSHERTKN